MCTFAHMSAHALVFVHRHTQAHACFFFSLCVYVCVYTCAYLHMKECLLECIHIPAYVLESVHFGTDE